MSDEAVYLLGYYARVQTTIELLVQFRLRPLKDVRQGIGAAYFEQMSYATRKRWLKSLATAHVDDALGARLESVYVQVGEVRNQIAHSPININHNGDDNPDDIRVGSARWMGKQPPSTSDLQRAQDRLEWVEKWILWLISVQESIQPYQKQDGEWKQVAPDRPSQTPPS